MDTEILRNLWALVDNDLPLLDDDLDYYKVDGLVDEREIEEIKKAIREVKDVAYKGNLDSRALSDAYLVLSSIYFKKPLPPEMRIRLEEVKGRLLAILSKLNVDVKKLDEEAKSRLQEKAKAVQQAVQAQQKPQATQQVQAPASAQAQQKLQAQQAPPQAQQVQQRPQTQQPPQNSPQAQQAPQVQQKQEQSQQGQQSQKG